MNMTRRGFLGAMLAACTAPAIVRADNIMRVFVPPERGIILWGDGFHDDTESLEAFFEGRKVVSPTGVQFEGVLRRGDYLITRTITPKVASVSRKTMRDSRITLRPALQQPSYMHFQGCENVSIYGNTFSGNHL